MVRHSSIDYAKRLVLSFAVLLIVTGTLFAQSLRFSNYREVAVPEYATVRIGPFYSTLRLTQSLGYRYTSSSGTGTDYVFGTERGKIKSDGDEFPVTTILDSRNYLLLTRWMDVDMSIRASYRHYPNETQDDEFRVDFSDEGIYGNFSSEFKLSEYVRGRLYDNLVYRTDYIDTRGLTDDYGGSKYENLQNVIGMDLDWLPRPAHNLGASLSRSDVIPRDDEFSEQERIAYTENISYQWMINAWLVAGLRGAWGQNSYPASDRPDSLSQTYDINMQVRFTEASVGNFSSGYSLTDTSGEDAGESNDGTIVGAASINTILGPAWSHNYGYTRSQSAGFQAAFDRRDSLFYNLTYNGTFFSGTLNSSHNEVQPSRNDVNGYSDWLTQLRLTMPLADVSSLQFSAGYAVRENEAVTNSENVDDEVELESRSDYETLTLALRLSTALTRSISGDLYAEQIERFSDADDLAYSRLNAGATLTYVHQF